MSFKKLLFILLTVLGIVGAGLSVAMVISAVIQSEWGRVVLYSVTMAICIEMTVLSILRLKPENSKE